MLDIVIGFTERILPFINTIRVAFNNSFDKNVEVKLNTQYEWYKGKVLNQATPKS